MTNISAQENLYPSQSRISKPVRIDTLYCWEKPDVKQIIHNEVKGFQCDTVIESYQRNELLYIQAIAANKLAIEQKDIALHEKDGALKAAGTAEKAYLEQIQIKNDELAIEKKRRKKQRRQFIATNVTLGTAIVATGVITWKIKK